MQSYFRFISVFILCGVIFSTSAGFAEDIKERMKNRIPKLLELKAKGIVGENNRGFLQFVGQTKEEEALVIEENNDRASVYSTIAGAQGTSAELVGQRRALQIVSTASPGDWLQDTKGNWYQK